jgi:tetratricopeptide (TPR) repeat protein
MMNGSDGRLALAAAMLATAAALPCAAGAQSPVYHEPPKLIKQGTSTAEIPGPGTVVVQVFVKADGTFKVTRIIRSTNHQDDQAALEIARTSKYAPATNGKNKVAEFYDFTLKFTAGSASASAQSGSSEAHASGSLQEAIAAFNSGKYSESAAAFDKVSSVPPQYKLVAANAYAKAAEAAISAKDASTAVADAKKANQYSPGAATYNLLGTAQIQAGDNAGAIQSLEQARTMASSDSKIDAKQRATIDANLVAAYAEAGQIDKASALVQEIKQLDPSNTAAASRVVAYYSTKGDEAQKAGDQSTAASLFDKAAALGGPYAATMYTKESFALMQVTKPDWKAAKAAADKALAIKPDDPTANLAEGIALANDGKKADAITYLQKADASAKASGDTGVASKAEQFLKQLGAGK